MTRKPRPNISPEDIGTFYQDGKIIYELDDCGVEPSATMRQITGDAHAILTKPISQFANFVRLTPERVITKPRKTRKDKGTHKVEQVSPQTNAHSIYIDENPMAKVEPGEINLEQGTASFHAVEIIAKKRGRKSRSRDKAKAQLIIHRPVGMQNDYIVTIGEVTRRGEDLKQVVTGVLGAFGGTVPEFLSDEEKKQLRDIIESNAP